MKKLLCIDGNSILNRQFYGIRYLSAKDGFPTNALFGLINVISREIDALCPDYAAVAFDLKAPTFRHKMYDAYKAGRHETPEALLMQMSPAKEICAAMGFTVLEREGYEADDILGTLASMVEQAAADGEDIEAYVLTGDKDSLQLISDRVKVLLASNSDTSVYDNARFFEKYGVNASQYVDVKALMGDSSDNIPGVKGIGEKGAFKLIAEAQSLDNIYENLDGLNVSQGVKNKLIDGKDSAYMSRTLATIIKDVPLGITLADIEFHGINRPDAKRLFERYEMFAALKKYGLDKDEGEEPKPSQSAEVADVDMSEILLLGGEEYALELCGNSLLVSDGERVWRAEFSGEIEKFLNAKKIVAYDCKNLYKSLEALGISWRGCDFDVMLGAYVDDSSQGNYGIDRLCTHYLGESMNEDVPAAWYIARIKPVVEERLVATSQIKLLHDIEMPLAGVLCGMEMRGVKIDCKGIEEYGEVLEQSAAVLETMIYAAAGRSFNINSPKQLGEVLFEGLMLPFGKKTKTGYSTSADVLEKLRKYHPIIDDILEYRQMTKLKSTYVDGLLRGADGESRVHTTFKQTGTATGRLSSTEPNLQNIPIRTEAGRQFRKYFVPTNEDTVLIDADYSQIELRVLAHISGDQHMIDAFMSDEDIHTSTACRVFGVTPDEVSIEMRKRAKAVNFGILYGMGEFSLSEDLKISIAKAKEYIRSYLDSYPKIEKYLSDVVEEAKAQGYVTTMFGRRRNIPELSAQNKNIKHFGERIAMNSPIQGSSADIIKIAMINVDRKLRESGTGARLILQVHDELLVESPRECAEQVLDILRTEMEQAAAISVPLEVEAKIGDTWFECH
ncbi:MAG: DNA polymerase I [Clostridia bacterium]|nr:DNA polymerase I [Clostridia bacterium]